MIAAMVGKLRSEPVPREEPEAPGSGVFPEEPTTLRPPRGDGGEEVSTYEKLRDSCRVAASVAPIDQAEADEELAIEAEVVRVALERGTQRPKA
jgi:hypothetical protein